MIIVLSFLMGVLVSVAGVAIGLKGWRQLVFSLATSGALWCALWLAIGGL